VKQRRFRAVDIDRNVTTGENAQAQKQYSPTQNSHPEKIK
jgi:hypothetical protein